MLAATLALLDAPVATPPEVITHPLDSIGIASAATAASPVVQAGLSPTSPAPPSFASNRASAVTVAQAIIPADDGTGTLVNQQNDRINITAGTAVDQNLFHSFEQFTLEAGQSAIFASDANVHNILARVVGGDLALINGLLEVTGSDANFYLINPAGIIIGPEATLNLPASFTATTANSVGFGGHWFSTLADDEYALFTGEPDSFLFSGERSGVLINAADLAVGSGETLTLVGGTVISTGSLSAENGQVVVQSVTGEKTVQLQRHGMLLSLEVETLEATPLELTPLSLPELLTGGDAASALGLTVAADGTTYLGSQPLLQGDLAVQQVEAGTVTLSAASDARLGSITTNTVAADGTTRIVGDGGSILVAAERNILVDNRATLADVASSGGEIVFYSREGHINTAGAAIDSRSQSEQRGGDIILHSLESITTGDLSSGGGNVQVTSTGRVEDVELALSPFFSLTVPQLTVAGGIEIQGDIDTRFDGTAAGGSVSLHGVSASSVDISTRNIFTDGGDLAIANGYSDRCSADCAIKFGGGIDTSAGVLDTSTQTGIGGAVELHSVEDVSTHDITSGGGRITLLSHQGEIDATARMDAGEAPPVINSSRSDSSDGGEIVIDAKDTITIANVISNGGQIQLDSGNEIEHQGILDSSRLGDDGGDIVLEARQDIVADTIVSGRGDVTLFSEKGTLAVEGVIDTRAADGETGVNTVSTVQLSSQNVTEFHATLSPDQLQLEAVDQVQLVPVGNSNGPSLGDPPLPPPAPLAAFESPDPVLPSPPSIPEPDPDPAGDSNGGGAATLDRSEASQPPDTPLLTEAVLERSEDRMGGAAGAIAPAPTLLEQLGARAYEQGDYRQAEHYYQQRLTLVRTAGEPREIGRALLDLASVYGAMGQYDQAVAYYQESIQMAQQAGDMTLLANSLTRLGLVYHALGDYDAAIEAQQQSWRIAQQLADRALESQVLSRLGLSYYAKTDYAQAMELQRQSLHMAEALADQQAVGDALEYLSLSHYALGEFQTAADVLYQSLAIAQTQADQHATARRLTNLGDALYRAGDASTAIAHLFDAIEIWEDLRQKLGDQDLQRVKIFETHETTYSTLQRILAETGDSRALEVTERGRSRALVELLSRGLPAGAQKVAHKVAASPPQLQDIRRIAKQQNATIVSYSVIKDINEGSANRQLEASQLYIWVVQPDGTVEWRQQDLRDLAWSSLAELVEKSRCYAPGCWQYQVRDRGLFKPLVDLHQLLIDPIADLLPADPTAEIVFIPDDDLFLVPFAALQNSQGDYLIEHHTLRTSPSIQALDLARPTAKASAQPLVVGNPTMPNLVWNTNGSRNWPLSPLLWAEQEALQVAEMLDTAAIIGPDATEPAVVAAMEEAPIIHLATHGLLDYVEASGVPGAIALAPTANEDGLLTTQEIMDLDLAADLVVLSACDTGRGDITSDGVIGLSRSLMATGVPSVVVSLWSVDDLATQALMINFYQHLEKTPSKAQALRHAMIETMKRYPNNPAKWAAFTLIGQG